MSAGKVIGKCENIGGHEGGGCNYGGANRLQDFKIKSATYFEAEAAKR